MSWTKQDAKPVDEVQERKRLRDFGLVMCFALSVVTGILLWKFSPWALPTAIIAQIFFLLGVFRPLLLGPFEKRWMQFAEKLSVIVSWLITMLTFYIVITPLGLLLRLFGKELLHLRLEPQRDSYWDDCDIAGTAARPFDPY